MYDAQCQWHINGSWHCEGDYNTVVNLTIRQNGNGLDVEGSQVDNVSAQFGSCWVRFPRIPQSIQPVVRSCRSSWSLTTGRGAHLLFGEMRSR